MLLFTCIYLILLESARASEFGNLVYTTASSKLENFAIHKGRLSNNGSILDLGVIVPPTAYIRWIQFDCEERILQYATLDVLDDGTRKDVVRRVQLDGAGNEVNDRGTDMWRESARNSIDWQTRSVYRIGRVVSGGVMVQRYHLNNASISEDVLVLPLGAHGVKAILYHPVSRAMYWCTTDPNYAIYHTDLNGHTSLYKTGMNASVDQFYINRETGEVCWFVQSSNTLSCADLNGRDFRQRSVIGQIIAGVSGNNIYFHSSSAPNSISVVGFGEAGNGRIIVTATSVIRYPTFAPPDCKIRGEEGLNTGSPTTFPTTTGTITRTTRTTTSSIISTSYTYPETSTVSNPATTSDSPTCSNASVTSMQVFCTHGNVTFVGDHPEVTNANAMDITVDNSFVCIRRLCRTVAWLDVGISDDEIESTASTGIIVTCKKGVTVLSLKKPESSAQLVFETDFCPRCRTQFSALFHMLAK